MPYGSLVMTPRGWNGSCSKLVQGPLSDWENDETEENIRMSTTERVSTVDNLKPAPQSMKITISQPTGKQEAQSRKRKAPSGKTEKGKTKEKKSKSNVSPMRTDQFDADHVLEALNNSFIIKNIENIEVVNEETETDVAAPNITDVLPEVAPTKSPPPAPLGPWRAFSLPAHIDNYDCRVDTSVLQLRAEYESLVDETPNEPHVRSMTADEVIRGDHNSEGCGSHPMEWDINLDVPDNFEFSSDEDEPEVVTIDGGDEGEGDEPADVITEDNQSEENNSSTDTTATVENKTSDLQKPNNAVNEVNGLLMKPVEPSIVPGLNLKPVSPTDIARLVKKKRLKCDPEAMSDIEATQPRDLVDQVRKEEDCCDEELNYDGEDERSSDSVTNESGEENNARTSEATGSGTDLSSSLPVISNDTLKNILSADTTAAVENIMSDLQNPSNNVNHEATHPQDAHDQVRSEDDSCDEVKSILSADTTATVENIMSDLQKSNNDVNQEASHPQLALDWVTSESGDENDTQPIEATGSGTDSSSSLPVIFNDTLKNIVRVEATATVENIIYDLQKPNNDVNQEAAHPQDAHGQVRNKDNCCDEGSQSKALKAENDKALKAENVGLKARVKALEAKLAELEKASHSAIAKVFQGDS